MPKAIIKVTEGPLDVSGDFEVVDKDGNIIATEETVKLCKCGKSKNMPFCEGSHKGK